MRFLARDLKGYAPEAGAGDGDDLENPVGC
jgi:hypothetical protein